jgi:magnesium transporter
MTARVYRGGEPQTVDTADMANLVDKPHQLVWVEVADPTSSDLECIKEQFDLHPLAIEDIANRHQRPKLDKYGDHGFIVAHTSSTQEVNFFVAPTWLVSVCEREDGKPPWSVDTARARFEGGTPEQITTGFLLYILLDQIVDGYSVTIANRDDQLEKLEEAVFNENIREEGEIHRELFAQQRELLALRRSVNPLQDVLTRLRRKDLEWIDDETITHLQDVDDHVVRANEALETQREILGNIVSAHFAMVSNNMNRVMKKMTSWGAILLGSALVAGIYGMNFRHMPELDWQYGYVYALCLMVVIALIGYVYFKRKGWL